MFNHSIKPVDGLLNNISGVCIKRFRVAVSNCNQLGYLSVRLRRATSGESNLESESESGAESEPRLDGSTRGQPGPTRRTCDTAGITGFRRRQLSSGWPPTSKRFRFYDVTYWNGSNRVSALLGKLLARLCIAERSLERSLVGY